MKKIRVIIIDDERSARNEVARLLENYPGFEVIGEAKNADDAKMLIEQKHPDLLFLDIQMPGKSGFELLESLEKVPQVIFTTAFEQYAVKAFEISVIDYLMKPIREERFTRAIEQTKLRIANYSGNDDQLFVKDGQQYHFITWSKVYLIESMDNYARLYFDHKKVFLKSSLNQLENKLDEAVFSRMNRTQIINRHFIDKVSTTLSGRLKITLKTGDVVEASERQSVKFRQMGRT